MELFAHIRVCTRHWSNSAINQLAVRAQSDKKVKERVTFRPDFRLERNGKQRNAQEAREKTV